MELFTVGFPNALAWGNLYYCFLGVAVGTAVGVLPGIGSIAAMSLLFPFTFYLDPTAAIIMLGGIYYGAEYGGSTAAILLNLPGTPSSAVTAIDGYMMAKNGRAGVALFMVTIASFAGGSFGILVMMFLSDSIAGLGLRFGSDEYFTAVMLGLVAAATVGNDSPMRGLAMIVLGMLLGCIGLDTNSAVARFTFGIYNLRSGLDLVALVMGLFGVATVILSSVEGSRSRITGKITLRSMRPTRKDLCCSIWPTARGAVAGTALGILPGTGTTMASFVAYGMEKHFTKSDPPLSQGAVEGITTSESANNAAAQTAFIPTLTLGIPGSPSMAIIFGALVISGITPGPALIAQHPDIFWGLIASFWLGNLMLLILNIPLIGLWVRLLRVRTRVLFPLVITLVCVGTYSVKNSPFDVWMVLVFSIFGVILMLLRFQPTALLLGFVLGPLAEVHFRNTMSISGGSLSGIASSPISIGFLVATFALLAWHFVPTLRRLLRL